MNLEDRLYTSTEVAEILGVSLRSVYRYLEEEKLVAEVKTATGRLRFTKQNILDFLHPQKKSEQSDAKVSKEKEKEEENKAAKPADVKESKVEETKEVEEEGTNDEDKEEEEETESKEDESVDWLKRFKSSAAKFGGGKETETKIVEEKPKEKVQLYYYRSLVGGLKEIAQNIDKVARKADVAYAFTLNAGASLYKPLKDPFSILHVYVRPKDREFFEKMLQLVGADESNAQLCLIVSDEDRPFDTSSELHGLYVVGRPQLEKDAVALGKKELLKELG